MAKKRSMLESQSVSLVRLLACFSQPYAVITMQAVVSIMEHFNVIFFSSSNPPFGDGLYRDFIAKIFLKIEQFKALFMNYSTQLKFCESDLFCFLQLPLHEA